jgi:hypothetical protein
VIRVDGYFLYQAACAIHPLVATPNEAKIADVRPKLWSAENWLDALLNRSVYRLRTAWPSGTELLRTVQRLKDLYSQPDLDVENLIGFIDHYLLTTQAGNFETVLQAELQWGQLYLVQPKGGFDLSQLMEEGTAIFPNDLEGKVPEAVADAREGARCIAFELPTAAAFHLHRVNEIVLRKYYDTATGGKPHPERRNLTAYIDAMKNYKVGDKTVFAALASLNSLHRNPVIHPEQRLKDVEEAIALHGSVRAAVSYMLTALAPPALELTAQDAPQP